MLTQNKVVLYHKRQKEIVLIEIILAETKQLRNMLAVQIHIILAEARRTGNMKTYNTAPNCYNITRA